MSDKKITYLLGAGASYQACPILSELGEKMILMSRNYLGDKYQENYNFIKDSGDNSENIMQNIGYFGRKAIEYGTIDTYAKKLYLNRDHSEELHHLKLSVSIFFTIWEITNDSIRFRTNSANKQIPLSCIDLRYISLLATFLEKSDKFPVINNRIRVVSWNYDLQIEKAYKSFLPDKWKINMEDLNKYFKFRFDFNGQELDLNIIHLNGYGGFFFSNRIAEKNDEYCFFDVSESKQISEILGSIEYVYDKLTHREVRVNDHINYAWEQSELAKQKREYAKKVFKESDVIVVIGYSFPPFNRQVDQMLFNELKGRKTRIYYQDPNASESLIKNYVDDDCEVIIINDRLEQFMVPYEF